jgi:hypothetical protein
VVRKFYEWWRGGVRIGEEGESRRGVVRVGEEGWRVYERRGEIMIGEVESIVGMEKREEKEEERKEINTEKHEWIVSKKGKEEQ